MNNSQLPYGFAAFALLAVMTTNVLAQDEEGFSGRVGLGYLATSGNSDNESLNANFNLWWNYDPWSHSFRGQTIRSTTSSITTAKAYSLEWQSRYAINESDYIFGLVAIDDDQFSAYDSQMREVVGYGRRLMDNEKHLWNAQAGIGARQSDLRNGLSEDESILYLGSDYRLMISETSQFSQTLGIEHGSKNTYTQAVSALSAEIMENLAIVLSYTIKNNSDVLPGTEKTDTITAVSIEYGF